MYGNTAAQTGQFAWGIPFEDAQAAKYTRAVMSISTAMTCLALVSVILQFVSGYYFSVGIFAAVILPLCGYYGARRRSKFVLSFFTCCNLLLSTLFVLSFILTVSLLGDYASCACNPECRADRAIPIDEARRICASEGRYRVLYWLSMGFAFLMAALQCAGAYYGMKLLRTREIVSSSIPVAQPVVGTYIAPVQPSYAPPTATAPYAPPHGAPYTQAQRPGGVQGYAA